MNEVKTKSLGDIKLILRGIVVWAISAAILLLIASLVFSQSSISSSFMGYCSSGISFLAAMFAALFACRGQTKGVIYQGMICAAVITVLLLSIGFASEGEKIKSAGVLSVVSFTIAGSLLGTVMSPVIFSGGRSRRMKIRRRK